MLIFGNYKTCCDIIKIHSEQNVAEDFSKYRKEDESTQLMKFDYVLYNFTSMNQDPSIMVLNGLIVPGLQPGNPMNDSMYYNAIMMNDYSFNQLMNIMYPLYDGKHVFICIDTLENHSLLQMQNDMLIWFIFERYGYASVLVNSYEDFDYFNPDDYRFSVKGIIAFDQDKMRYIVTKAQQENGGGSTCQ